MAIPLVCRSLLAGLLLTVPLVPLAATADPPAVQKLLASDGQFEDSFGNAVAISGNIAVIGAELADQNGIQSGSAYVFGRDATGTWSQVTELVPSDGDTGDLFGVSVAISGANAVIGAWLDNDNGFQSGSAYVYRRDANGAWSEEAKLLASDGAATDLFGFSVAVSGATALVSAHGHNAGRGAAYVYARTGRGEWVEQTELVPHNAGPLRSFGFAVALSGATAVISARVAGPATGADNGAAYVFTRGHNGRWSERAKLLASDRAPGDAFGFSVAVSADMAVVGAPFDDDNGRDSGSAYVYARNANGQWLQQAKLVAGDGAPVDRFGWSVAISGDTVVVGADLDDDNAFQSGSAYVFARDVNGIWSEQAKLLVTDGKNSDLFGSSVAVSGSTAVIGAPDADDNGPESGAAYAIELDPVPVSATLQCPGDIDGDGVAELALVTSDGRVFVKNLSGHFVNGFALRRPTAVVDTELLSDRNTNGAPELVLLTSGGRRAEVRDLLTSALLGTVPFDRRTFDLEIVPDQTGNGAPELAGLARQPVAAVEVRDALTAQRLARVPFAGYVVAKDLYVYPVPAGRGSPSGSPTALPNGAPLLSVLGDNKRRADADKIEVRDQDTGGLVQEIWLGSGWQVLEQEPIADLNGDGIKDVAVLRVHPDGRVNVQIRDTVTRERIGSVGFPTRLVPRELVTIADINGNGADELVVFGRRFQHGEQEAVIKDSRTGQQLNAIGFDPTIPGRDFVRCGDINGNGATDLAMIGQRVGDPHYQVVVKDSRTGVRLARVGFK